MHPPDLAHLNPLYLLVMSVFGASAVLVWRIRETMGPVTVRKIVIPPLGMSTGFSMFIAPATRIPVSWASAAFLVGAFLFSIPLARTSSLTRRGDEILMRRSKAFLWILLALVAVRFALRTYVERFITPVQTGSLFFVLAFGMILRWRLSMLLQFLKLRGGGAGSGGPEAGEPQPAA